MTKEFSRLLEILRLTVFGEACSVYTDCDLERVCELAQGQGVLPLVFAGLSEDEKKSLDKKWEKTFLQAMFRNEQKMVWLAKAVEKLREAGIESCVLKGSTVARDYARPECRLSGDVDLYIDPKDETAAMEVFRKLNMEVEPRLLGDQDFKAKSPAAGLFEVHVQLYAENFRKIVLRESFGVTEPFQEIRVNDYLTVNGLGPVDMLNFLTAHLIKHFVREGCGIRQITDLLAYVVRHKEEIDFEKYLAHLEELRFKKLILNVFGIGVKFFGLQFDEYLLDSAEKILNDIEEGSSFGQGDAQRQGFYEQFLRSRVRAENDDMKKMKSLKKKRVLSAVLLPDRAHLIQKGYNYLGKSPILYPIAYIHRLFDLAVGILFGRKKVKKAFGFAVKDNEKMDKRLKMMKELEIVE